MNDTSYFKQARLLLTILPLINKFPNFALKGGTAINFFVRNLPRMGKTKHQQALEKLINCFSLLESDFMFFEI